MGLSRSTKPVSTPDLQTRVRRFYAYQGASSFAIWIPFWALWIRGHLSSDFEFNSLRTIVRLLGVRSATTPTGSWNTRSPTQNATSTSVNSKSEERWPRIHSAQNGIQIANDDAVWYA